MLCYVIVSIKLPRVQGTNVLGVFCEAITDRLLQPFEVFMEKSLLLDEHDGDG